MTKQISQLNIDELDQVSGGGVIDVVLKAYLDYVKNVKPPASMPESKMTLHMR